MVDVSKEKEPMSGMERVSVPEETASVEAKRNTKNREKENLEVTSWIEKIEKKFARVPNDTSDASDDSVVVQPDPQSDQPPVTLPVTQQQMYSGKKAKTDKGIAWLVTWAIRQIKLLAKIGRKVKLQDLPEMEQTNKPT